jgi:hypothetical protein
MGRDAVGADSQGARGECGVAGIEPLVSQYRRAVVKLDVALHVGRRHAGVELDVRSDRHRRVAVDVHGRGRRGLAGQAAHDEGVHGGGGDRGSIDGGVGPDGHVVDAGGRERPVGVHVDDLARERLVASLVARPHPGGGAEQAGLPQLDVAGTVHADEREGRLVVVQRPGGHGLGGEARPERVVVLDLRRQPDGRAGGRHEVVGAARPVVHAGVVVDVEPDGVGLVAGVRLGCVGLRRQDEAAVVEEGRDGVGVDVRDDRPRGRLGGGAVGAQRGRDRVHGQDDCEAGGGQCEQAGRGRAE